MGDRLVGISTEILILTFLYHCSSCNNCVHIFTYWGGPWVLQHTTACYTQMFSFLSAVTVASDAHVSVSSCLLPLNAWLTNLSYKPVLVRQHCLKEPNSTWSLTVVTVRTVTTGSRLVKHIYVHFLGMVLSNGSNISCLCRNCLWWVT